MIKRCGRPAPVVVPPEVTADSSLSLVDLGLYVKAVEQLVGKPREYGFEELVTDVCRVVAADPDVTYPEVESRLDRLAPHLGFVEAEELAAAPPAT